MQSNSNFYLPKEKSVSIYGVSMSFRRKDDPSVVWVDTSIVSAYDTTDAKQKALNIIQMRSYKHFAKYSYDVSFDAVEDIGYSLERHDYFQVKVEAGQHQAEILDAGL